MPGHQDVKEAKKHNQQHGIPQNVEQVKNRRIVAKNLILYGINCDGERPVPEILLPFLMVAAGKDFRNTFDALLHLFVFFYNVIVIDVITVVYRLTVKNKGQN